MAIPYRSRSQMRKFHAMLARGEISSKTVDEFDKASKGKKLPEKITTVMKKKKRIAIKRKKG